MTREAVLRGGPMDGKRYAVQDHTSRMVFQTTAPPRSLVALAAGDPDAPIPLFEHRYDYEGERLLDGGDVFVYQGLTRVPGS